MPVYQSIELSYVLREDLSRITEQISRRDARDISVEIARTASMKAPKIHVRTYIS